MGGSLIGIGIEILVATLLVVTIFYCVNLNRKLERLRADETDMKAMVGELIAATGQAEHAIQTLKSSAADWDQALGARMRRAEKLTGELHETTDAAEEVLERLKQICAAAKTRGQRERESAADRQAALDKLTQAASFVSSVSPAPARPKAQAEAERPVPEQIGPRRRGGIRPQRADSVAAGRAA